MGTTVQLGCCGICDQGAGVVGQGKAVNICEAHPKQKYMNQVFSSAATLASRIHSDDLIGEVP
jgi:hypothetical protein